MCIWYFSAGIHMYKVTLQYIPVNTYVDETSSGLLMTSVALNVRKQRSHWKNAVLGKINTISTPNLSIKVPKFGIYWASLKCSAKQNNLFSRQLYCRECILGIQTPPFRHLTKKLPKTLRIGAILYLSSWIRQRPASMVMSFSCTATSTGFRSPANLARTAHMEIRRKRIQQ